ncbi:restriction endonuclease subunit S [Streptomyces sp. NPDC006996]|uniref:restriction endonuclease subunit S n=1 Tax=Streptomyces sp. NPDC006996 TaxID=3156908 RepID=UPI0033C140D7
MTASQAPLGDVADFYAGASLQEGEVWDNQEGGYLLTRVSDMNRAGNERCILSARQWSADPGQKSATCPGDAIVIPKRGGAIGTNKKRILRRPAVLDPNLMAVKPREGVLDLDYLHQWFLTINLAKLASGSSVPQLNKKDLGPLHIPLPPLARQKRIAAVLDQVDTLRAKRREAIGLLDDLAQSIFLDMFGNLQATGKVPLSSVANIASGITKGRKEPSGELQGVPYLAVANVQDRKLNLSMVKEISVSAAELERFKLRSEDLLLTEGGDPDKLGRGTLWREELPVCIHQNHVFRVRVMDREEIDPVYLSWVMSSRYGKSYFLRIAKQTTGIASINKTQLGDFPLPVSPIVRQREFRSRIEGVQAHQRAHRTHLAALDELFTSLQHRAFSGTLWDHEATGESA